jgi:hypothetical protein
MSPDGLAQRNLTKIYTSCSKGQKSGFDLGNRRKMANFMSKNSLAWRLKREEKVFGLCSFLGYVVFCLLDSLGKKLRLSVSLFLLPTNAQMLWMLTLSQLSLPSQTFMTRSRLSRKFGRLAL